MRIAAASLALAFFLGGSTPSFGAGEPPEQVIEMTAKRFEYAPAEITVKKGVPVVLEITALDRKHGFTLPAFGVRSDLKPGVKTRIRFTPDRTGTFNFHCDVFCGDGHEGMTGAIVVVD